MQSTSVSKIVHFKYQDMLALKSPEQNERKGAYRIHCIFKAILTLSCSTSIQTVAQSIVVQRFKATCAG